MITVESLLEEKERIGEIAEGLTQKDVEFLVSLLSEKNDEIRYQAFLVLQKRSESYADVYPYWDLLAEKLGSDNSYQRSIGIMLLAENIRWDGMNRFEEIAEAYLSHCSDERFITSRQTIQSIGKWIGLKPQLITKVKDTLIKIKIGSLKETQQKLILMDIIGIFAEILKIKQDDDIAAYLVSAMTGSILDKKSAKQIEKILSTMD